jgi:hypothetical protein
VTVRSKAYTVFARSNTGVLRSNTTQGMDVCVRLFCVCVVLCVGRHLAMGSSPVQGVLPREMIGCLRIIHMEWASEVALLSFKQCTIRHLICDWVGSPGGQHFHSLCQYRDAGKALPNTTFQKRLRAYHTKYNLCQYIEKTPSTSITGLQIIINYKRFKHSHLDLI